MILFHPLASTIIEYSFNLICETGFPDVLMCEMYVKVLTVDNNRVT